MDAARADVERVQLPVRHPTASVTHVVATVRAALGHLAAARPIFHSEADFQQALAWQLHLERPDAAIRLETRPLASKPLFLDLAVNIGGARVAVELKYLVRALKLVVNDEAFALRPQGAHDVRRYDVVKDLARLEALVCAGAADVGVAIVLSNDPGYWRSGRGGTVDAAYRLMDGGMLSGRLAWGEHAGPGTTRTREAPIELAGRYRLRWRDYSDVRVGPAGQFRYLFVMVPPSLGEAPVASLGA